jgi:hypothetical protein
MRKLKLVGIVMIVFGFWFSGTYASLSEALLNEAQMTMGCGVEGLQRKWDSGTVASFRDSIEECCKKLRENLPRTNDEHLVLMRVQMESILEIVQELDEFSKGRDDNKKQRLRLIAYRSDPDVQSLILRRLEQIEKEQSGGKGQPEEEKSKMAKGKNSTKGRKK